MKRFVFAATCLLLTLALLAEDREGATIRYRTGSTIKFDTTSKIQDEDSNWTLSSSALNYLSTLATTPTLKKNFATTNTPATLTNIIQSIDGALSLSNDWQGSFTGDGGGLTNVPGGWTNQSGLIYIAGTSPNGPFLFDTNLTSGTLWVGLGATNTLATLNHALGGAFLPLQAVTRPDLFPSVTTHWEFNIGMDYNDASAQYTLIQGTGDTVNLADGTGFGAQLAVVNSGPASSPGIAFDTISSQTGTNDDANIELFGVNSKTILIQLDSQGFNGISLGNVAAIDALTGSVTGSVYHVTSTTNQIWFGATNTQPATTSAVFWASCKVAGLTNEFRLMLVSP